MNRRMLLLLGFLISLGVFSTFVSRSDSASADKPKASAQFEEYRTALKKAYQVDIVNFKDRIKGGYADGKGVTDYKLAELLEGIKFEREHTNDSLLALEMAMDHLERIPDYYAHLARMERACASEKLLAQ